MKNTWVGQSIERVEDARLLRGEGQFADDIAISAGTCHAAFVRSPYAHALIEKVSTERAERCPGVVRIITGAMLATCTKPLITGVKVDAPQFPLAVDRVRYVGEPVAIVIAEDRYLAEDAAEEVAIDYTPLKAVVRPQDACAVDAPILHAKLRNNVLHEREFCYGEPERLFAQAQHVITTTVSYPRNACTPIECSFVLARYERGEDAYDITSSFPGPFTLHTVMARSLCVPGNRLRLKSPADSGGSFGVKQSVFPQVVAIGIAAKLCGRPVKWLEDRLEHLSAATSATNRVTTIKGAFDPSGRLLALDFDQLEDCGAYLRAPEPATLYRMHGNMTGAYAVAHLKIRNRVVVTNKTPTGLNRGFGGPQVYFPLERLMDKAAAALEMDTLEIREINLVAASEMPYRTASGALLDSGDYARTVSKACERGGLARMRALRDAAKREGRYVGIGMAAVVEPSISNMGYITTLLTPEQRERAGAKNGALATATVSFEPSGNIIVNAASLPQGQGHQTVLAQVVADVFGVTPHNVAVCLEHDTARDAWSIASGNYSSRFAGAVTGAAQLAASKLRERIAIIAAGELNVRAEDVIFSDGNVVAAENSDNAIPLARCAAKAHWSPLSIPEQAGAGLRETAFWNPPCLSAPDAADRINSSGAHGFIFDICVVEIDPDTAALSILDYVTAHDAGTVLNPLLADGQIRGGFAHGLGAALLEEFAYANDGAFLSGTFADYLPPSACEVPSLTIVHDATPSPVTPLGSKGLGEGNCMSTPVCIANAVADALEADIDRLPLTRSRLSKYLHSEAPPPPTRSGVSRDSAAREGAMHGHGRAHVSGTRSATVWERLLDPESLRDALPGCTEIERSAERAYVATLNLGVGPVRGVFIAQVTLSDLVAPSYVRITGTLSGPLGSSEGEGELNLSECDGGTDIDYTYRVTVSGKVAAVGGRLLDGAARALIGEFFTRLSGGPPSSSLSLPMRLRLRLRRLMKLQ